MKRFMRRAAVLSAAAAAAVTLTALGSGPAFARPSAHPAGAAASDPSGKLINGWGAISTQDVYTAFTTGFTFNGSPYLPDPFGGGVGSWDAINPTTGAIEDPVTPVPGGDTFERPFGSRAALAALSAAWDTANPSWTSSVTGDTNTLTASDSLRHEEITFARSSILPEPAGQADDLTYFPQAVDAVGVAEQVNGSASAVGNLNTAALTAIYTGGTYTQSSAGPTVGDVQESGGYPYLVTSVNRAGVANLTQVVPVLPDAVSGIRSFFLGAIGASSFDASLVANETGSVAELGNDAEDELSTADVNAALAENNAAYTVPADSIEIVPFSGAAAIEQEHGLALDTLGTASFPTINGDTLFTGSGDSAAIGTLQTAQAPSITSLVGDFARDEWAVLPSSVVVTGDPSGEGALQTWLDQTLEDSASQAVWSDYGFDPITTATSDNPSDWETTGWQN